MIQPLLRWDLWDLASVLCFIVKNHDQVEMKQDSWSKKKMVYLNHLNWSTLTFQDSPAVSSLCSYGSDNNSIPPLDGAGSYAVTPSIVTATSNSYITHSQSNYRNYHHQHQNEDLHNAMTRRTNSNYSTRLSQVRSIGASKDHQFEEVVGYGTKRKNSSTIDLMEVDGRLRNGELLMDNSRKRYVLL